jgi:hypothetical protein
MTPIPLPDDFDSIEPWSGGVRLGPGTHIVKCVSADDSGKSSGGHNQIELELEAVEGEEVGATIRDWQVITVNTWGKVKQLWKAFGAPKPEKQLDAQALVGKTAKIVVRTKMKDNGDEVNRVEAYQPAGDVVDKLKEAFPGSTEMKADDDLPF